MALQVHMNGGTLLQFVCHTRTCSLLSTTAGATIPSSVGRIANAWSGYSLLANHNTHSREKQRCPLRAVQCSPAAPTKEVIVDKGPKYDEEEFPPLLASVVVEGFPPCQGSVFADEALAYMLTIGPVELFEPYYHVGISFISFVHPGVVSAKHLAAMAGTGILMTIMDDILFDVRDPDLLEKLGIDPAILASPEKMVQYMRAVEELLRQEERPASPTALEDLVWKNGRDLRALFPSIESFNRYADAFSDFLAANYEVHRDSLGAPPSLPDLATYTEIRLRTVGAAMTLAAVPLWLNSLLPAEILENPVVERLSVLTVKYMSYNQDIFSYACDFAEGSTNNLLHVLMASEPGMTLPQAAWKAVNMTRALAQEFLELEATQVPSWEEPLASDLVRRYIEGLKEVMSGYAYWHSKCKRYRHPDSPFPEMRDVNVSFLPYADSLKVNSK